MRAALAVLAAGYLLKPVCYGSESASLQDLPVRGQILLLWRILSLGYEPLHQIFDFLQIGEILALKGAADGLRYQQVGLM